MPRSSRPTESVSGGSGVGDGVGAGVGVGDGAVVGVGVLEHAARIEAAMRRGVERGTWADALPTILRCVSVPIGA